MELLEYLMARHGRVSYERVVSGPGLVNVYQLPEGLGEGRGAALARRAARARETRRRSSRGSPWKGRARCASQALDLFVSVYGAEAGNLALKVMATGGVYLGGGIAPKIVARLKEPDS